MKKILTTIAAAFFIGVGVGHAQEATGTSGTRNQQPATKEVENDKRDEALDSTRNQNTYKDKQRSETRRDASDKKKTKKRSRKGSSKDTGTYGSPGSGYGTGNSSGVKPGGTSNDAGAGAKD